MLHKVGVGKVVPPSGNQARTKWRGYGSHMEEMRSAEWQRVSDSEGEVENCDEGHVLFILWKLRRRWFYEHWMVVALPKNIHEY